MKALILGGGGQVGRALVAAAPAHITVTAVDRAACDVSDANRIEACIAASGADIIFNAAAYTAVDKAETEPNVAQRLNAEAPGVMAAAARKAGARFVHISTDFVFDGAACLPRRPGDPTSPLSVYGRTKLAGETAAIAAHPDSLIVRSAWIYAPKGTNFVNTMLRLMRERDRVAVVSDQIGSPTSALSLATALWSLAHAEAVGLYHYTDSGVASWYDFAVAIAEEAVALGLLDRMVDVVPISTAEYPTPARRPAYGLLDKASTTALLGVTAPHWRVNLRLNLQELQANG